MNSSLFANIAQWLVQLFCKQQVVGSNPTIGSKIIGRLAEWLKAVVLKTIFHFSWNIGSNPLPSASSRLNVNENI